MKLLIYILFTLLATFSLTSNTILSNKEIESSDSSPESSNISLSNKKDIHVALKTNGLYDLVLIPNIGIELGFNKHWSMNVNWMYAWWNSDTKHNFWRIYGGDLELRYWLKESLQKGHHFGTYTQALTYDFEFGNTGYQSDKWSYAIGVSYGYTHPISKRLSLDFSIGIGYLSGKYKEYLPIDHCYVWQSTKQRHWFGPTKAEISLVWLLNSHHDIKKKGGKR